MMTLVKRFTQFVRDEEGASAIEYALIAAMVAVVLVLFVTPVGNQVKSIFNQILVALGGTAV
jgi:pilus assembly protein Flp/PilA